MYNYGFHRIKTTIIFYFKKNTILTRIYKKNYNFKLVYFYSRFSRIVNILLSKKSSWIRVAYLIVWAHV